jgi:hypothetical protein
MKQQQKTGGVMNDFDLFESDSVEAQFEELKNLKSDEVKNLGTEVEKLLELKKSVTEAEVKLSYLKQLLRQQETEILPELMLNLNCQIYGVEDSVVTVEPFVQCSIPGMSAINLKYGAERAAALEKRNAALAWLEANNLDGIIKNEININVGRDSELKQKCLIALAGIGVPANVERNVNAQTLKATVKELRKKNIDIPKDLFNLYEGSIAKVKKKK